MTDGDLVRQARAGSHGALAELTNRWARKVLALCHIQIGSAEPAADLAQEALLRAMKGLGTLTEPEKFGPWLRGIAKRVCLDWLKAKKKSAIPFSVLGREQDLLNHVPHRHSVDHHKAEQDEELHAAVDHLPEECREVLLLYYYEDVTYQDLAELLQVSSATINARLTRARALLREHLLSKQESFR
jgi:RNA polymerase sigma-70 factor (ECF subfamily)